MLFGTLWNICWYVWAVDAGMYWGYVRCRHQCPSMLPRDKSRGYYRLSSGTEKTGRPGGTK
ncbi:hypothetical protein VU01_14171, partial [Candidatus Electrothrix marina]